MNDREAHLVEALSMRAYPALEEVHEDGYALRAANGYTKRANSARVLEAPLAAPAVAARACEAYFSARGQPATWRLTSISPDAALNAELDARGYATIEPTRVMVRALGDAADGAVDGLQLSRSPEAWSTLHARLSDQPPEPAYAQMLNRIEATALLGTLHERGVPVACAMGVVEGPYIGLFNIVVAAAQRRRGLGAGILAALLNAGREQGATRAYLQVVAANPAVALYERLGFADLYDYHYRVGKP